MLWARQCQASYHVRGQVLFFFFGGGGGVQPLFQFIVSIVYVLVSAYYYTCMLFTEKN